MPIRSCPTHQELSAYLAGELDDDRFGHLTQHVDDCSACQETVVGLDDAADTAISDLRHGDVEEAFESEAECQKVLDLVAAVGQEPSQVNALHETAPEPARADLGHIREYRLLAELGKGGMGTVYKALHTKLGKVVALKVLAAERVGNEESVARFEREMQAVGRLEHPNIVRATDAGELDGVHYLVMEYVRGTDLSSLVKRSGPLDVPDACELIRQAALGLQYAHLHGMVHRDIKPSNLMLTHIRNSEVEMGNDDESSTSAFRTPHSALVKILDLGLALLSGTSAAAGAELTSDGQIMGTLDYMAPEQGGDSHLVDIRADIYALGATLYKLLCGEAPFGAKKYEAPVNKLMALATQKPTPLCERRPDVPAELSAIVDRMLAKTPVERFATPREVAHILAPFAAGHHVAQLVGAHQDEPPPAAVTDRSITGTTPMLSSALVDTSSDQQSVPVVAEPSAASVPDVDEVPAADVAVPQAARPPWLRPPVVAVAIGLLLAAVAATVMLIRIATDNGELVIESATAGLELLIKKRTGEPVRSIELEQGPNRTTLRSGEYEITFVGAAADKFKIENGTFTIQRNGRVIAKVTRVTPDSVTPEAQRDDTVAPWPPGPAGDVMPGLIGRPATRPGIRRWQLETRLPRNSIGAIAWSPDGRLLALGTDNGLVRIYDGKTRELVRLLVGHRSQVTSIAWHPDDLRLVSADYRGFLKVWASDGTLVRSIDNRAGHAYSVAWHPDGEQIVWGAFAGIRISEVEGFPRVFAQDLRSRVRSIALSPDGRYLAAGYDDHLVRLWDADGNPVREFSGHTKEVTCVAWNSDGTRLVSAGGGDRTVRLWNVEGAAGPVTTLTYGADRVAWRPDGKQIIATTQTDVWLLDSDAAKQRIVRLKQGRFRPAWHPKENVLALGGSVGRVILLDEYGEPATLIEGHGPVGGGHRLCWSLDGETVAAAYDLRLWRWNCDGDVKTQFLVGGYGVGHLDLHPQGILAATSHSDRKVRVWNLKDGRKPLFEMEGNMPRWSPDGSWLAFTTAAGVELWDRHGTKVKSCEAASSSKINALAWTPDGQWLAAGDQGGKTHLWSRDGQLRHVFEKGLKAVMSIDFSRDSKRLASVHYGGELCYWNIDGSAGDVIEDVDSGFIAWSPVDQLLAIPATRNREVFLRREDGTQQAVLPGHLSRTVCADFDPKTGVLATIGSNTIRLWDAPTGDPRKTIVMLSNGRSATFSAAGQMLDGDEGTFDDDFVHFVEQPDGRFELRSRLDEPGQSSPEPPKASAATVSDAPSAAPTLPDQQRPFVVIRGETQEAFERLSDVLAVLQQGDVIEVHGNGPFMLDKPIDVSGKGLVLRAAPGYRPRFVSRNSQSSEAFRITCDNAPIEIEGCDLDLFTRLYTVFTGGGPPWSFRNCRFYLSGMTYALGYSGPRLTISDCFLWNMGSGAAFTARTPCDVTLQNNVVVTDAVLGLADGGNVVLENNTIVSRNLFHLIHPGQEPVRIRAERNLVRANRIIHRLDGELDQVVWTGRDNILAGTYLGVAVGKGDKHLGIDLDTWLREPHVVDEDSRQVPDIFYRWDWARRANADEAAAWLAEMNSTLRKQYDRPQLGPDWGLVGAGDAYVRALAAEGRVVPEDELRPQTPLAGPFVIMHEGEIKSGCGTLQEAIAVAADGDVVEIRTDGPVQGIRFDGSGKHLTVRAAPGYRPVIDGSIAVRGSKGTQLNVEGLHFRDGGIIAPADPAAARVVRVANCAFNGTVSTDKRLYDGVFLVGTLGPASAEQPAEIVNCLIPRPVLLDLPADHRLTVKNSVVAGFEHHLGEAGRRHLELERCLVWSPAGTIGGHRVDVPGTLDVVASHTLFETGIFQPGSLVTIGCGTISAWQGSGNLYRLGNRSWLIGSDTTVVCLEQWQQHWQSDADSIEARPLEYDVNQWQPLPDSPGPGPGGESVGADVTRIGQITPATNE